MRILPDDYKSPRRPAAAIMVVQAGFPDYPAAFRVPLADSTAVPSVGTFRVKFRHVSLGRWRVAWEGGEGPWI